MVKVKVCGITNVRDASMAIKLGADALGFIFAPSPRMVSPEKALEIICKAQPMVTTVGVFVGEDWRTIRDIVSFCGIDLIQLHGNQTPSICNAFMPRSIKSLAVKDSLELKAILPYQGKVRAILLDTFSEGRSGGTGKTFDWKMAIKAKTPGIPIILAGGITPSNIEEAVSVVNPYCIDVNSGVERSPGEKAPELLEDLMVKIGKQRVEV